MSDLQSCAACTGLVPSTISRCPHCGQKRSRAGAIALKLAAVAAGGSVAITLMACYGPPPRNMEDAKPPQNPTADSARGAVGDAGAPPSAPTAR